jgi:hypothetical protein
VVKRVGRWWIGWLVDVPGVNAQERTRRELLESLRIGAEDLLATEVEAGPGESVTWIEVSDPLCVAEAPSAYGSRKGRR